MADISSQIYAIQVASRGEEVRDAIIDALTDINAQCTPDAELSAESQNAIQNQAVAEALSRIQESLVFDSTPTEGSTNPVTSGGIYTAMQTAGATPDWAENDDEAADFIKSRPFYSYDVVSDNSEGYYTGSGTYTFQAKKGSNPLVYYLKVANPINNGRVIEQGGGGYVVTLISGNRYRVTINGVVYEELTAYCGSASFYKNSSVTTKTTLSGICLSDEDDEILIVCSNQIANETFTGDMQHTVSCNVTQIAIILNNELSGTNTWREERYAVHIEKITEAVVQIPIKYIPTGDIATALAISTINSSIATLRNNVSSLQSSVSSLTQATSIRNLQSTVSGHAATISSLSSTVSSQNSTVRSLQDRVSALEETVSDQAQTIAALQSRVAALEALIVGDGTTASVESSELIITGAGADVDDDGILEINSGRVSVVDGILVIMSGGMSGDVSDGELALSGSGLSVDNDGVLEIEGGADVGNDGILTI